MAWKEITWVAAFCFGYWVSLYPLFCFLRSATTEAGARRIFGLTVATRNGVPMNGIIYLVGLVVVVMFILSFLGLR